MTPQSEVKLMVLVESLLETVSNLEDRIEKLERFRQRIRYKVDNEDRQ